MNQIIAVCTSAVLVVSFFVGSGFVLPTHSPQDEKKESTSKQDDQEKFEPIDNMHHFMEYISLPSYEALKEAMKIEPENRRAWKPIKSHALILAETSALVAARSPEDSDDEQVAQWEQLSLDVYNAGKALYTSAGDLAKAKEHYGLLIDSCNKCHQEFDNGKHQLEK